MRRVSNTSLRFRLARHFLMSAHYIESERPVKPKHRAVSTLDAGNSSCLQF
jgi:hypothetical protein